MADDPGNTVWRRETCRVVAVAVFELRGEGGRGEVASTDTRFAGWRTEKGRGKRSMPCMERTIDNPCPWCLYGDDESEVFNIEKDSARMRE